jgi:hypothetical protein
MLRIVSLEKIHETLLQVPALVDQFERRELNFLEAVRTWLTQTEKLLSDSRLPVVAQVAALRATLLSAERGSSPGANAVGRSGARKLKDATAADVLGKAQGLIAGAISEDAARLAEGERLAQKLAMVAARKGLVPADVQTNGEALGATWRAMSADIDIGAATTHLAGLVGSHDALILLSRMLPRPS